MSSNVRKRIVKSYVENVDKESCQIMFPNMIQALVDWQGICADMLKSNIYSSKLLLTYHDLIPLYQLIMCCGSNAEEIHKYKKAIEGTDQVYWHLKELIISTDKPPLEQQKQIEKDFQKYLQEINSILQQKIDSMKNDRWRIDPYVQKKKAAIYNALYRVKLSTQQGLQSWRNFLTRTKQAYSYLFPKQPIKTDYDVYWQPSTLKEQ